MPRVVAVGRDIDRVRLQAAFAACTTVAGKNEQNLTLANTLRVTVSCNITSTTRKIDANSEAIT